MSTIKPPAGPKVQNVQPLDSKAPAGRSEKTSEAFQAALGEAGATPSTTGPTSSIAAELRAGTLDVAGAVNKMVEQALSAPMAKGLDAVGRKALESHLRESLKEDPTLAAMVADLDTNRDLQR